MSRPLKSKVAEFLGEGQLDSQGRFTLDLERAQFKLTHWRSSGPYDWLFKTVQAAVQAGCKQLIIQIGHRQDKILWVDFPVPDDWGEQFLESLTRSDPNNHLLYAFRGAPGDVTLSLGASWLQWKQGQLRHSVQPQSQPLCLTVDKASPVPWFRWFWQRFWRTSSLRGPIVQRILFCPIAVQLNGSAIARQFRAKKSLFECILLARDGFAHDTLHCSTLPNAHAGEAIQLPSSLAKRLGHASALRSAHRAPIARLRLPQKLEGPARITLVRCGVSCQPFEIDLGLPGLEILLTAPALKLDLSEFTLIQSKELEVILKSLAELVRDGLRQARESLRKLPLSQRLHWHKALPWLGLVKTDPPKVSLETHSVSPSSLVPPEDQAPPVPTRRQSRSHYRRR